MLIHMLNCTQNNQQNCNLEITCSLYPDLIFIAAIRFQFKRKTQMLAGRVHKQMVRFVNVTLWQYMHKNIHVATLISDNNINYFLLWLYVAVLPPVGTTFVQELLYSPIFAKISDRFLALKLKTWLVPCPKTFYFMAVFQHFNCHVGDFFFSDFEQQTYENCLKGCFNT